VTKSYQQTAEADAQAKPAFEDALDRLEKIVEQLDDGNIPLADALTLFREGNDLAATCRSLLDEAERQVTEALEEARPPANAAGQRDSSKAERDLGFTGGQEEELPL